MSRVILVKAAYDRDAHVWYVEYSDVPGLRIEAATMELLMERLPGAIQDLLEDTEVAADGLDMPIEVIAHASTRVRLAAA